jgi:hypothetical protein
MQQIFLSGKIVDVIRRKNEIENACNLASVMCAIESRFALQPTWIDILRQIFFAMKLLDPGTLKNSGID